MGLFEFLMVLVSVVIGLGVTEILTGWANMLRIKSRVRFYWVHTLFQLGVFFALLQQWWELWLMSKMGEITFISVLVILSPSILIFLIANLLFPGNKDTGAVNLKEYYYSQSSLVWVLAMIATLIGTFIPPVLYGYDIFHWANISGIPVIILCLILANSKKQILHSIIVPLIFILILLDTILSNPVIKV